MPIHVIVSLYKTTRTLYISDGSHQSWKESFKTGFYFRLEA